MLMRKEIDFDKYQYFFNGWIARKSKRDGKTEIFRDGQWVACKFKTDINLMAHVGDADVVELDTANLAFLKEQLSVTK